MRSFVCVRTIPVCAPVNLVWTSQGMGLPLALFLLSLSPAVARAEEAEPKPQPSAASPMTDPADDGARPAGVPEAKATAKATNEPVALAACPATFSCAPDELFLAALLRLEEALSSPSPKQPAHTALAIHALSALGDARAVPTLLGMSHAPDPAVRLAALQALGLFTAVPEAERRLEATLAKEAPIEDAAVALPGLLAAAREKGRPSKVPCPDGGRCVEDELLLGALLAYQAAATGERASQVAALGGLGDPRAVPLLWRLTYESEPTVRQAAIVALGLHSHHPAAKERLLELLVKGERADKVAALPGLFALQEADVTDAILAARVREQDAEVKKALEEGLIRRAPQQLQALLDEERRRAEEEANAPEAFHWVPRALVSGTAGLAGAYGGAAASSLVADQTAPGFGGCFGLWGACAGCASGCALGWFALGDRQLTATDVGLALSGALWGGYAGLLLPPTLDMEAALKDWRHMFYSAGAGHLLGLGLGTLAATFVELSTADLVEMHLAVAAMNALAIGTVLTLPSGGDARFLPGAAIAGTLLGVGAAAGSAYVLDLDAGDMVHIALNTGLGLLTGLAVGLAVQPFEPSHPTRTLGATLLGSATGIVAGATLAYGELTPSSGGMIYEGWAGLTGGGFGFGAGLLLEELGVTGGMPGGVLPFSSAASGLVLGAASTALFPDGISQDLGDLLLQPLLVGFSLYHATALAAVGGASARLVGSSALLAPATVSAALVYSAPFIDASAGDVLMVGASMGWGAYLSSMVLASLASRNVPGLTSLHWVLGTSLAMDAGLLAGVLLNFVPSEHLGWQFTYVTSVATATTLVLSLPGSLLALSSGGVVTIPDVLLASTLIGTAVGLLTAPFIDFRIAPDLGLGRREGQVADGAFTAMPTLLTLAPSERAPEDVPLGFGLSGTF